MPRVVTANDLRTGAVVYRGASGWVHAIADATIYASVEDADGALAQAQGDAAKAIIVDPFVTEFEEAGRDRPKMTLRDTIRAFGPTIRFLPSDAEPTNRSSSSTPSTGT